MKERYLVHVCYKNSGSDTYEFDTEDKANEFCDAFADDDDVIDCCYIETVFEM